MKKRFVLYNGGTQSYYGCSSPDILVVGRIYEVINEEERRYQTDYTLKGVVGHFNSFWFEELSSKPTYFVIAHSRPEKGLKCNCLKPIYTQDSVQLQTWLTSTVISVDAIGLDTYKAVTQDSIYIVSVNSL